MSDLVEYGYVHFPPLAAKFYDYFMQGRATRDQVRQIALDLALSTVGGRLIDIGTGPGRLLAELHILRPELELFGLDISQSMIQRAQRNLGTFSPELRVGSIRNTPYEDDYFDIVTCTGSFYVWQDPVGCLNEIKRITKPGGRAILFETYRDFPRLDFLRGLSVVSWRQAFLRGLLSPILLSQQLKMTYRLDEIEAILRRSSFGDQFEMRRKVIARLPIWVRIELRKAR